MTAHEKIPSVMAHGATKIRTREMLCSATLPTPPAGHQCSSCGYFRTPSAVYRPHSFCRFTGEKVRPDDTACFAWPGHDQGGAA